MANDGRVDPVVSKLLEVLEKFEGTSSNKQQGAKETKTQQGILRLIGKRLEIQAEGDFDKGWGGSLKALWDDNWGKVLILFLVLLPLILFVGFSCAQVGNHQKIAKSLIENQISSLPSESSIEDDAEKLDVDVTKSDVGKEVLKSVAASGKKKVDILSHLVVVDAIFLRSWLVLIAFGLIVIGCTYTLLDLGVCFLLSARRHQDSGLATPPFGPGVGIVVLGVILLLSSLIASSKGVSSRYLLEASKKIKGDYNQQEKRDLQEKRSEEDFYDQSASTEVFLFLAGESKLAKGSEKRMKKFCREATNLGHVNLEITTYPDRFRTSENLHEERANIILKRLEDECQSLKFAGVVSHAAINSPPSSTGQLFLVARRM